MSHETSGTRPTNLKHSDPVHFAKHTTIGGVLCEELRTRYFGSLWDGVEGFTNTHMAGSADNANNFRFTLKPSFVSCPRCKEILTTKSDVMQGVLLAVKEWMKDNDTDADDIQIAAEPWIAAGCPGLKETT